MIGFGKEYAELYGLGGKFDEAEEEQNKVSRFHSEIDDLENGKLLSNHGARLTNTLISRIHQFRSL